MTTQTKPEKQLAEKRKSLAELLNDDEHTKRFKGLCGTDARSFMQNILAVYNAPKSPLANCEPESIIAAAEISASINLSILPSLGQSCLVPYREGKDGPQLAQWQIMWKGLVQLAHRTGQYSKINLARVYEGQLVRHDEFKGTVELNADLNKSDRVQGYYFYFALKSGATFEFYWSAKKAVEHGLRYSKSFQAGSGKWLEDPAFEKAGGAKKWLAGKEHFLTEGSGADAMSAKTIVKNELNKWGPLETRIKELVQDFDQAVVGPDGKPRFIDTTAEPTGDAPGRTYLPPPAAPKGERPAPADLIAWARDAAKKQGVSNETFDAWLAEQPGDLAEKADAAEKAWKKVAAKQATALETFVLAKKEPGEKDVAFKVYSVTDSEFEGEPATCIRDVSEPPVKRFTTDTAIIDAAKAAKESGATVAAKAVEKKSGKNTFDWLTRLA